MRTCTEVVCDVYEKIKVRVRLLLAMYVVSDTSTYVSLLMLLIYSDTSTYVVSDTSTCDTSTYVTHLLMLVSS